MKQLTAIEAIEIVLKNLKAGRHAGEGMTYSGSFSGDDAKRFSTVAVLRFAAKKELYIKPKTRTINGIEVQAPDDVHPKKDQEYWFLSGAFNGGIWSFIWSNNGVDRFAFKNGLWTNKDDALANAKALQREPEE